MKNTVSNSEKAMPSLASVSIRLPRKITIQSQYFEIYRRGDVLKMYYQGTDDAIYKFDGAVFGLSVRRVQDGIKDGKINGC